MTATKKLYIAISDSGDGSQALFFTFDTELIRRMGEDYNYDVLGENWMSGDGFQYQTIKVPESTTMEDLGISQWQVLDRSEYAQLFEGDEEE